MQSDPSSNPNVGPGSYLGLVTKPVKFSKAPFTSKSNRTLTAVDSYTPGKLISCRPWKLFECVWI